MSTNEHLLGLVNEALDGLDSGKVLLSATLRRCIRIARLRNDYVNLWWLEWEMVDLQQKTQKQKIIDEVRPHLTREELQKHHEEFSEAWIGERKHIRVNDRLEVDRDDVILATTVSEVEMNVARSEQLAAESFPPTGMHPVDLYFADQANIKVRNTARSIADSAKMILERIKHRAYEFLSRTEKQLVFGQLHSDIFEKNRQYVDLKLGQFCPDAMAKFVSAYQRLRENTPESRAQALTSCRRLMKSLADTLYPATDTPVIGADGQPRVLGDDKYIARMWQYVYERTSRSTSGEMLLAQIQDLGNRIEKLYDLANKGVHSEVTEFEVNQCVIQTYLLAGDLLRIAEDSSAVKM